MAIPRQLELGEQAERLYRVRDVMQLLSVSRGTVYNLIARGELEVVHPVPGSTRITHRSLERYVARIGG
jgi:excisionase family DNA binding protein